MPNGIRISLTQGWNLAPAVGVFKLAINFLNFLFYRKFYRIPIGLFEADEIVIFSINPVSRVRLYCSITSEIFSGNLKN